MLMVPGLEVFRNWFRDYPNRYVVIGGTACNLILAQYGAPERATHDIDMVIVAESFDDAFYRRFVSFVRQGGYQGRGRADKPVLYHFLNDRVTGASLPRSSCLANVPTILPASRPISGDSETSMRPAAFPPSCSIANTMAF